VLALTIDERETIMRALDDVPPALEELPLCCFVSRVRDGLV
jgi:hypothetical protein